MNGIVYLGIKLFILTLPILLKLKLTVYLITGYILYAIIASFLLLATFLLSGLLS